MSLQKSKYLSDALLNWEKGTTMPAAPATLYVALLTTMPTKNDGTSLVEVTTSGTAYARQPITGSSGWNAITTAGDNVTEQVTNNALILWAAATASYGTVLGIAIYDAVTAGNMLAYGTLTSGAQLVSIGNVFSIPAGNLTRQEA
jgi:hypothetical protein